jgi:hypothetical protein
VVPLPKATGEDVLQKTKECPLLGAREVKVNGLIDVQLSDGATLPVNRLPNPLNAPAKGLLVTRQTVSGQALLFLPGDSTYDNLSPPVDATKEIIVQATVLNFTVRLLAF